jgi:formylglycine-generating enzyme
MTQSTFPISVAKNTSVKSPTDVSGRPLAKDMVWITGDTFLMGSDQHYPEEAPAHKVAVDGFWIDKYLVTNAQFQKFVKATGYVTFAERPANPDDYPGAKPNLLQPSSTVFVKPDRPVNKGNHYNWWSYVSGANWQHPEGRGSSIKGREQHPVVHLARPLPRWLASGLPLARPIVCRSESQVWRTHFL